MPLLPPNHCHHSLLQFHQPLALLRRRCQDGREGGRALLDLRQRNADLQKTSRSFQARYEASQIAVDRANVEIKNLRTELELGLRLKNGIKTFERPIVTIRDPLPDLSDCELGARIGEDA